MKKGITPVIAVILLLLITIAMVGFAFIWFGRVLTISTNATQAQLESQLSAQAKKISIDNINSALNTITIRNIGSQSVAGTELALYVNSTVASGCTWNPSSLPPGTTSTCNWSTPAPPCAAGTRVKVTAPGNFDEVLC